MTAFASRPPAMGDLAGGASSSPVADGTPCAVNSDRIDILGRHPASGPHAPAARDCARNGQVAEQIARVDFNPMVLVDTSGAVTFANAAAQTLLGMSIIRGQSLQTLFPSALQSDPDAVAGWLQAGVDRQRSESADTCELRARCGDDKLRTLEAAWCTWSAANGASAMAVVLRDVSRGARASRRGRNTAQTDPLTGLPNLSAILATIETLHKRRRPFGVALLGLDNFRLVNDTLGYAIGNAVLQVVACRLLARLPVDAHLARFGGDEFALVFPGSTSEAIETQLHAMLREIGRPCEINDQRIHVDAGIGLAMATVDDAAPRDRRDPSSVPAGASELVARAGLAMQQAKRLRSERVCRFEPGMRTEAIDRRKLDLELRRACKEGEFELHYQPQIDMTSGRPTGAEALLRWRHPERGLLAPVAFIDALAHSAVAPEVGRWILQRACRDAAAWPEVGGRPLSVAVNLFPVQFDDVRFLDEVDHALASSGLPAARLELELTETIALRNDGVAEHTLMQLRARGIRVAYDDFGTGYASLSMLHRLPADRLKIDRSFVSEMMKSPGNVAIVRSIALIASNFNLQVIAEGVETTSQADLLRQLGCNEVQGYLYSTPLAPADFDGWLAGHVEQGRVGTRPAENAQEAVA